MMRRTASTQICLDWWGGSVGLEQWRLLNQAGPFLAAAYTRSAGPTSRLATWLKVDPDRTAFDGRLLYGDDPIAAYATFAAGAAVFTAPGDVSQHLTTLFPPVRPRRRYLEVRFLDVQPLSVIWPLAGVLSALMYDDCCRAQAARMVRSSASELGALWHRSAQGDEDVREQGLELVVLGLAAARLAGVA
jgi:glutamate--cysteine ligase